MRDRIQYKLFKLWCKREYKKFLKERNWDFDHSSITEFLILKLTIMGIFIAKYGYTVPETRHPIVRNIWLARYYLCKYRDAFDIAENLCQSKFIERYGVKYETEFYTTQSENGDYNTLNMKTVSNVPDVEEATEYWRSLDELRLADQIAKENLNKAFGIISEYLMTWWD